MTIKYFKIDINNIKPGQIYLGFSEAFGDFYDEHHKNQWNWGKTKKIPLIVLDVDKKTKLVKVVFATNSSKFKEVIIEIILNKSKSYLFNKTDIAWIKQQNLTKFIGNPYSINDFKILKKQSLYWFNNQANRVNFEKLLKSGSYFQMTKDVQEYKRRVNQFEPKEQLNRDNPELRQKRLELQEASIKFKRNKFNDKN